MSRVRCVMNDKLVPDVTTQEVFNRVTAEAAVLGGRVERPDAGTLVVVTRYSPAWSVLLAWGLIRRENRVTIIGRDVDDGARFTVAGWTNEKTAQFLKGYLVPVDEPMAVAV